MFVQITQLMRRRGLMAYLAAEAISFCVDAVNGVVYKPLPWKVLSLLFEAEPDEDGGAKPARRERPRLVSERPRPSAAAAVGGGRALGGGGGGAALDEAPPDVRGGQRVVVRSPTANMTASELISGRDAHLFASPRSVHWGTQCSAYRSTTEDLTACQLIRQHVPRLTKLGGDGPGGGGVPARFSAAALQAVRELVDATGVETQLVRKLPEAELLQVVAHMRMTRHTWRTAGGAEMRRLRDSILDRAMGSRAARILAQTRQKREAWESWATLSGKEYLVVVFWLLFILCVVLFFALEQLEGVLRFGGTTPGAPIESHKVSSAAEVLQIPSKQGKI